MLEQQSRAAEDTADTGGSSKGPAKTSATALGEQPQRKWLRVLQGLLAGSLNRWDATKDPIRDWCLPSTVAELEKRGLKIDRRDEEVPGHYGPVRCSRYWVAPESRELAR